MPLPTGVVSGPLMATLLRRIESSTCFGSGSPNSSITPSPASCTSQSISTPVASMTRRAASLTSGPTPSPGINVIVCRAMLLLSSSTERRKSDKLRRVWTRGLARWYEVHGRHDLPWRATADPWAILVSEVMLQQTQVARVSGRWESFLARWPTPGTCAAVPLADVLREWQGLGYPRRARALHDTARLVSAAGWPDTESGLRSLPGVGAYTAR